MKSIYEHQSHPSGIGFLVKEYRQTYFTSGFHFHDLYELIFINKSYGKLYTDKEIFDFKEGDIFLLGPGYGHCFYNDKSFVEKGEEAHATTIFFKRDFLGKGLFDYSSFVEVNELLDKAHFGLKITDSNSRLKELFLTITKRKGLKQLILLLEIFDLLSGFDNNKLKILSRNESMIDPYHSDSMKLQPVLEYVLENFKSNITNEKAANLAHMNEAAFCRYFKKRMELTFSQYVNNVRMDHAKELLLYSDQDVSQICYECGYNNISYFNRKFRETTKKSPKQFRDTFKKENPELIMDEQLD
jgi:AraC-like DNA-binding protein